MQLITSLAFLAIAASGVFAQGLQINTPASITECEPTQLTFSGGTPPYIISILPGGQIGAAAVENLGTVSGNTLTWNADIASNTPITFQIKDSTGATAFSAIVTVQGGSSTSCVGKNSLTSGSASGTASGSASGSASGTTPVSASTSGASSAGSSAATSAVTSAAPGSTALPVSSGSAASKPASSGASATSAAASASASASKSAAMPLKVGSASGFFGMLLAALLA